MSVLVDARDLVVSYDEGRVVAVDGLSLQVSAGEVVGVLGGNGAGKSSTLRTFAGVNPPSSGSLAVAGNDMAVAREAELARNVVGYAPDVGGLIRQATVREHVGLALGLRGRVDFWPSALELVERFDLLRVLDRETGGFSHGMSRRLSVVLAVLTAERVLVLDEPFDGVDPLGVAATEEVIRGAAREGLGVVVSTHLLSLLSRVSDRICVMSRGKVVAEGGADHFDGLVGEAKYAELLGAFS